MDIYHKYIKVPMGGIYESEISFVESFDDFDKNFLSRDEYWVQFKNEYEKLTGFYQINISVNNFFGKLKEDFLKKYNDKINNIECAHRHYAYVKIINDKENPQLNGQIMLFRYGRKINNMLTAAQSDVFNKSFLLRITMVQNFQNFDKCKFSENNYYIRDINLNVQNIPSLKRLDLIKDFERKIKLGQITKKIKDKDNEKICM